MYKATGFDKSRNQILMIKPDNKIWKKKIPVFKKKGKNKNLIEWPVNEQLFLDTYCHTLPFVKQS